MMEKISNAQRRREEEEDEKKSERLENVATFHGWIF